MATNYHVFGAALVEVGTGASNALENLGFSTGERGVSITAEVRKRPIYTDVSGPETPAEWQAFNTSYTIEGEFVVYDEAVRAKLEARNDASSPAEGKQGTPGRLEGTGGYAFILAIAPQGSPTSETPFYFPNCILENSYSLNVGSVNTVYRMRFRAWPFVSGTATTAKGIDCMHRSIP